MTPSVVTAKQTAKQRTKRTARRTEKPAIKAADQTAPTYGDMTDRPQATLVEHATLVESEAERKFWSEGDWIRELWDVLQTVYDPAPDEEVESPPKVNNKPKVRPVTRA
jgi:hypothetical protein